jgi:RNA polymerase sigma-B factor
MNYSTIKNAEAPVDQPDTEDVIVRAQSAAGDDRSALEEIIVRRFSPMVRHMAQRYGGPGWDLNDLDQVANLALIKALRRFDPSRGSFESYAKATMSGELKNYLRDYSWSVKPPRRVQAMHAQIRNSATELAQVDGEFPSRDRLAEHLGAEVSEVDEAASATSCQTAASIDQPVGEMGRTLGDTLCSDEQPYSEIEDHVTLLQICTDLSDAERNLIRLRFFECLSQREIAEEIGISQMQVSRRLAALIDRLRAKAREHGQVA